MTKRVGAKVLFAVVTGAGLFFAPAVCGADEAEPRPDVSTLRLSEADVLARFTTDVRTKMPLRTRALTLWRAGFAAQAAKIQQRYLTETDWRPALADASALVDSFLEASLLPRAHEWPAGDDGHHVWIETLDPKTGQRVRVLRPAATRAPVYAPTRERDDADKKPRPSPRAPEPAGPDDPLDGLRLAP